MLRSSLLSDVPHGFTGVADGDLRPGAPGRDTAAAAIVQLLGGEGPLRVVSQVHGDRVVPVAEAAPGTEADAVVSTERGVTVAIRVADCVPILYALGAPGDVVAVAAVHAGWRGTAADIPRKALRALRAHGEGPVRAAIGPAICGACYEVGDDVITAVAAVAPGEAWRAGVRNVDLAEANAAILRAEGARVEVLGRCTRCEPEFWSHRRDGAAAGRQVGAIRL